MLPIDWFGGTRPTSGGSILYPGPSCEVPHEETPSTLVIVLSNNVAGLNHSFTPRASELRRLLDDLDVLEDFPTSQFRQKIHVT